MGCSSSNSIQVNNGNGDHHGTGTKKKAATKGGQGDTNDFVVDDISDPNNVKQPIEVDNGYGPGRTNKGEPPAKRPAPTATVTKGNPATTAASMNGGNGASSAPMDARSRYAMSDEPAGGDSHNDDSGNGNGSAGGLPGLGGLPSFAPRRYEDVHPPAARGGGGDDDDEDNEPKPQGDQAVTDLFRRYADNARGGGGARAKTVVMRAPSATFGALADQSKANSAAANDTHDMTSQPIAATPATAAATSTGDGNGSNGGSLIAAATISGRDDNDDGDHDISSSRIGQLKMNASRRSHSESHNQRSSRRHRIDSESQPGRVPNNNNNTNNNGGNSNNGNGNGNDHPLSPQPTTMVSSSTTLSAARPRDDDDEFG